MCVCFECALEIQGGHLKRGKTPKGGNLKKGETLKGKTLKGSDLRAPGVAASQAPTAGGLLWAFQAPALRPKVKKSDRRPKVMT